VPGGDLHIAQADAGVETGREQCSDPTNASAGGARGRGIAPRQRSSPLLLMHQPVASCNLTGRLIVAPGAIGRVNLLVGGASLRS
jgi:hypothetical protein